MQLRDYLQSRRVPFEILLHRPVSGATRLAQTLHVPGRNVAKSVLLNTDGGYLLAVLPATHRIDFSRLSQAIGAQEVRLAGRDELARVFTDCEPGAVPALGHLFGVRTVVDSSLAGHARIVFGGKVRHEGVRMRFQDFEALEEPKRIRFATKAGPSGPANGKHSTNGNSGL